jgi:hypothetical protein
MEAPDNRTIRVNEFDGTPLANTPPADTSPRLLPELWVVLVAVLGGLYVVLLLGSFTAYRKLQAQRNHDTQDIPEDAYYSKQAGQPAAAWLGQPYGGSRLLTATAAEDLQVYPAAPDAVASLATAPSYDGPLSPVLPTSTSALDPEAPSGIRAYQSQHVGTATPGRATRYSSATHLGDVQEQVVQVAGGAAASVMFFAPGTAVSR